MKKFNDDSETYYGLKTWEDTYEQMKKDIELSFSKEIKEAEKEIKRHNQQINFMKKDLEKL